ncbi:hypothetical protein KAI32_02285 [Candidatus Pacearchaeota archaeon]|nr:hypothetical protein [Candidatus Pacearchaeota archaeon]
MENKIKLVSVLLVLAVVLSLASISMSLSFKDVTPIVSRSNVVHEIVHGETPVGNVGLVVEKNNFEGSLEGEQ